MDMLIFPSEGTRTHTLTQYTHIMLQGFGRVQYYTAQHQKRLPGTYIAGVSIWSVLPKYLVFFHSASVRVQGVYNSEGEALLFSHEGWYIVSI